MGKKDQNRRRRQQARAAASQREFSWCDEAKAVDVAQGRTPEALRLASEFSSDNEVACRTVFLSDPIFGAEATSAPDEEMLPVLLLEAKRMMAVKDTRTGSVREMRMEALISGGFQRIDSPVWRLSPADGWGVYRNQTEVFLRDPDGEVAAKSTIYLDPAWVSAAVSLGWILVLYGYPLGVTVPPGKTERSYTEKDRAYEITQARRSGLLTGAIVKWHGALTETLDWVLFPPGTFGLPIPVAYVPLFEFNRHGGPEEFGFSRLNRRVMLPIAEGMTATITGTDLDLVRPNAGEVDRLIAGYQAVKGSPNYKFFQTWRRSVLSAEGLVVMAGNREIPNILGASQEQDRLAYEVMGDSWGAKVALDKESLPEWAHLSANSLRRVHGPLRP
jgi:hypothetical protein